MTGAKDYCLYIKTYTIPNELEFNIISLLYDVHAYR